MTSSMYTASDQRLVGMAWVQLQHKIGPCLNIWESVGGAVHSKVHEHTWKGHNGHDINGSRKTKESHIIIYAHSDKKLHDTNDIIMTSHLAPVMSCKQTLQPQQSWQCHHMTSYCSFTRARWWSMVNPVGLMGTKSLWGSWLKHKRVRAVCCLFFIHVNYQRKSCLDFSKVWSLNR